MKDELVIIRRYLKTEEAEVGQGLLESDGIQAFVADDLMSNVYPGVSGASGGVRLMVRQDDLDRARKVLEKVGGELALPDNFEPPPDDEPAPAFPREGFITFLIVFLKGGLLGLGAFVLLAGLMLLLGFGRGVTPRWLGLFFVLGGLLGLFCLPAGFGRRK